MWYEGAGTSNGARRFLHADPRGSIVAVTSYQGPVTTLNAYDEYGIPDSASGNDIAAKGRFLQTDPIGYEDQFSLYAYAANDPVNGVDSTGSECWAVNGNVRCRLSGRPSSKSGQARYEKALRAYTQAAAKADAAAKTGSSYTLEGYHQATLKREDVQVQASQIRDSLFKSPAQFVDEVIKQAQVSHISYAGNAILQIYKNGITASIKAGWCN